MHAYTKHGDARHYQQTLPGAKKAQRRTTAADMQKLGLLPSVTEITKMFANAELDEYKLYCLAEACYNNPPDGTEEFKSYRTRMKEIAEAPAKAAADFGDAFHASIEKYFTDHDHWDGTEKLSLPDGQRVPCREFVLPVACAIDELGITPLIHENSVVNAADGYAGRCDMFGRWKGKLAVVDYKTKKTSDGKDIGPINVHRVQIAAYGAATDLFSAELFALKLEGVVGFNIYVSSTEIGRIEVVEYNQKTIKESFAVFENMLALWRWRYFDPRVRVS